jgi:hypothetical protein
VTLGTFDYISPEQALEPRDADVRSDIYSLGCTFYHMLTGQPPVPEGTAAKKLHHHQHVRPLDPRQFVPDLPDEVAIILDRMMAKHPKDRYQSPEQLVHHLLLAARKLGAAPEVPEGVLSVEAALPSPPGSRPLLLAALAAAAVVLLIVLLDQSSPSGGPGGVRLTPSAPGKAEDRDSRPGDNPDAAGPPPVRPARVETPRNVSAPTWVTHTFDNPTAQELASWLSEQAAKGGKDYLEIVLGGDLDLDGLEGKGEPGLVVKAPKVRIRAKRSLKSRPTVRLTYNSGSAYRKEPWAALTIESESRVEVEGLRFVVDGREADVAMVGLWLRGGSSNGDNNTVSRCEFVQAKPAYDGAKRMASVVVEGTRDFPQPAVTLSRCCFYLGTQERMEAEADRGGQPDDLKEASRGGQDAVVRRGAARVTVEDCAFGPHVAAFRLEGGADEPPPMLVRHCSVMAGRNSAVFSLADRAGAVLDVSASLFARPGEIDPGGMMMDPQNGGAVLIRGGAPNEVTYKGTDNRYYLDGYWPDGKEGGEEASWDNFLGKLKAKGGEDVRYRLLTAAPWKDPQPLRRLEPQKLEQAFEVDRRSADLRLGARGDRLVGAEYLAGSSYLADLPALPDRRTGEVPASRRVRVVDPDVTDSREGTYSSLEAALADARPGDEIQIKANGELRVDPVQLKKPALGDLTLRPFPGSHPVLTLGETTDADAVLFRVQDGRLQLVDLEFLLRPRDRFDVQALVALAGDGQCLFKNCAITLDRGGRTTTLAVATVPEVGKVMKTDMPTARPRELGPQLSFENCFVRGDGDLVWGRTTRPFELAATSTLAALTGSFLNLEVRADAPAAPPGQKVVVRLKDVTTYLGGHLVRVGAERDLSRGWSRSSVGRPTACSCRPPPAGPSYSWTCRRRTRRRCGTSCCGTATATPTASSTPCWSSRRRGRRRRCRRSTCGNGRCSSASRTAGSTSGWPTPRGNWAPCRACCRSSSSPPRRCWASGPTSRGCPFRPGAGRSRSRKVADSRSESATFARRAGNEHTPGGEAPGVWRRVARGEVISSGGPSFSSSRRRFWPRASGRPPSWPRRPSSCQRWPPSPRRNSWSRPGRHAQCSRNIPPSQQ